MLLQKRSMYGKYSDVQVVFVVLIRVLSGVWLCNVVAFGDMHTYTITSVHLEIFKKGAEI